MSQKDNIKRKRSQRSKPSGDTLALLVVVPFFIGAILCAYAEYVPHYTKIMRQVGGWLAILSVWFFLGSNGIIMVWGLLPRFYQAFKQKELMGKLLYITLLITGFSFIFSCVYVIFALWRAAVRP